MKTKLVYFDGGLLIDLQQDLGSSVVVQNYTLSVLVLVHLQPVE